jgi:hypothetical protein
MCNNNQKENYYNKCFYKKNTMYIYSARHLHFMSKIRIILKKTVLSLLDIFQKSSKFNYYFVEIPKDSEKKEVYMAS